MKKDLVELRIHQKVMAIDKEIQNYSISFSLIFLDPSHIYLQKSSQIYGFLFSNNIVIILHMYYTYFFSEMYSHKIRELSCLPNILYSVLSVLKDIKFKVIYFGGRYDTYHKWKLLLKWLKWLWEIRVFYFYTIHKILSLFDRQFINEKLISNKLNIVIVLAWSQSSIRIQDL